MLLGKSDKEGTEVAGTAPGQPSEDGDDHLQHRTGQGKSKHKITTQTLVQTQKRLFSMIHIDFSFFFKNPQLNQSKNQILKSS